MSRHFFYRLFPMLKSIIKGTNTDPLISLYFSIGITYGHGAFALATNVREEICITKKYKYDTNGFTNFMIVDDKGRHFNVNNSFWYWKWDAIEEWTNIHDYNGRDKEKDNNKICIGYYGYRIPFLGLFPNIVEFPTQLEHVKKEERDILKHLHI